MWDKENILWGFRKIGVLAGFVIMFSGLVLLISMMRTTYLSLVNYDESLVRIISGRVFICGFQYPSGPIGKWYVLFTIFTVTALPCTVLARWFSQRKSRLAYWSFVIPTVGLYLYLLLILTLPFSWLIQYIARMGFTPKRIYGLFYGIGGYIVILTFLWWAVRRPDGYAKLRRGKKSKSDEGQGTDTNLDLTQELQKDRNFQHRTFNIQRRSEEMEIDYGWLGFILRGLT